MILPEQPQKKPERKSLLDFFPFLRREKAKPAQEADQPVATPAGSRPTHQVQTSGQGRRPRGQEGAYGQGSPTGSPATGASQTNPPSGSMRNPAYGEPASYVPGNQPAQRFHDLTDPAKNIPPADLASNEPAKSASPAKPAAQLAASNVPPAKTSTEEAAKKPSTSKRPSIFPLRFDGEKTRRAYWDVAAMLSLVVNTILIGILIVMALQIQNLKTTVNDLLGGLYSNFVKMDQSAINTTIPVNGEIPINFDLTVSQNTDVVLTSDVYIPNADVVINTGVLNINARAAITLKQGTSLPIALNLVIPVQKSIPINLQVPVTIPLSQTQLHEPFTGLQTTLRPLYCTFNKNAQYPQGTFICAEHDPVKPGTP